MFKKMHEKKLQTPTKNVQMLRAQPCTEYPSINIFSKRNVETREDKVEGKRPTTHFQLQRAPKKNEGFDLQKEKETFVIAKKDFADPSTSKVALKISIDTIEGVNNAETKLALQACIKILCNKKVVDNLQALINIFTEKEQPQMDQKDINKVYKNKRKISHEMHLTTQIGDFEIEQVILDLGYNLNVITKKTLQKMGEPKLEWSTIQLCMENQQKIIPMVRIYRVIVVIEGVKELDDFEVIQIFDDLDPCLALLGLDWAIDMDAIINLKRRNIVF